VRVAPVVEADVDAVAADLEQLERARRKAEAEEAEARARAEAAREEAAHAEARAAALREEAARLEQEARDRAAREAEAARREETQLEETLLQAARDEAREGPAVEAADLPATGAATLESHPATATIPEPLVDSTTPRVRDPEPDPERAAPTCDIRFWRGYRKAAFFARTIDAGEEVAVAESPMFRARGNGVPERTDEAAAAYAVLVDRLEDEGWRRVATGSAWFDATFAREP
jgi:hypothetical protein